MPATTLSFPLIPGESAGDRIARILHTIAGTSLQNHPEVLRAFAAGVEDHPDAEMQRATNCATSMRWLWAWAQCPHPLCHLPDEQIRMMRPAGPVDWVLEIARELGAFVPVVTGEEWKLADRGWGLWYGTPGYNNDHMETCLGKPDANGVAPHGGGGRGANAILESAPSDIRKSLGRPLRGLIDPSKLQIPTLPSFDAVPEAPKAEPAPVPDPSQEPVALDARPASGSGAVFLAVVVGLGTALAAFLHHC